MEAAQGHGVLVVFGGREDLAFLRRDRGVAVDQAGEDPAQGFDPQRQRRHVKQNNVFHVALQHACLNGGTSGHNFIGVHALVGLFAEELGHFFNHARHAGHTADQHHFVDVCDADARIFQRRLAGLDRPFDQVVTQVFQLGAGQFDHQVQRLA